MRVAEFGTAASVNAVLTKSEYSAPILSTPMASHTKPHQTGATKGNVRAYLSAFPDKEGGAPDQTAPPIEALLPQPHQNGPKRTKTDQNGPQVEAANKVQQVKNKVKRG